MVALAGTLVDGKNTEQPVKARVPVGPYLHGRRTGSGCDVPQHR